jgi:hypothetical protein
MYIKIQLNAVGRKFFRWKMAHYKQSQPAWEWKKMTS